MMTSSAVPEMFLQAFVLFLAEKNTPLLKMKRVESNHTPIIYTISKAFYLFPITKNPSTLAHFSINVAHKFDLFH